MQNEVINLNDLAQRRFATTLCGMVGQGRPWSATALADATGIQERTIHALKSGERTLGFHMLWICGALGPGMTNSMLELIGQTGAHRVEGEATPAPGVLEHMLQDAHALAAALADGRVDHQERAELVKRLPNLIATLARFHADLVRDGC